MLLRTLGMRENGTKEMNPNKVVIFRQNAASQGAKILARSLGVKMIKPEGSRWLGASDKAVINWGSGTSLPFNTNGARILNKPETVARVTNKKHFFEMCREAGNVSIPDFTTRKEEAKDWLRDGHCVFARTVLQGSQGVGIVELNTVTDLDQITNGTLMVKYIKKKHEFRIHVAGGFVVDKQQKKKRSEVDLEDINWRIRSHDNGFVFCRNEITVPRGVLSEAVRALGVSGLDFGAVDVIWNKKKGKAYVLEINTAPGLEGSTVLSYRHYFASELGLTLEEMDTYDIRELASRHGINIGRG